MSEIVAAVLCWVRREIRLGMDGWWSENNSVTDGGHGAGRFVPEGVITYIVCGCREALKRVTC